MEFSQVIGWLMLLVALVVPPGVMWDLEGWRSGVVVLGLTVITICWIAVAMIFILNVFKGGV